MSLPLRPPLPPLPHPTPLRSSQNAWSWSLCASQQLPASCLSYTWRVCTPALLSQFVLLILSSSVRKTVPLSLRPLFLEREWSSAGIPGKSWYCSVAGEPALFSLILSLVSSSHLMFTLSSILQRSPSHPPPCRCSPLHHRFAFLRFCLSPSPRLISRALGPAPLGTVQSSSRHMVTDLWALSL